MLTASLVAASRECTIYVAIHGGDDHNPGTASAPFKTIEAAVQQRTSEECSSSTLATILVSSGKYYIENPPLVLGKAASSTVIRAKEGASVTLSAGALVDDSCWQQQQQQPHPTRANRLLAPVIWKCSLPPSMQTINPSTGDLFQTLYSNGKRLRKARYPNHDPTSSEKGWLIVNSSRWLGPENGSKFVVGVKAADLPAAVLAPSWSGGTIQIFPTRSWINIVNVTFSHLHLQPEQSSGDPLLRHFEVQCPPVSGLLREGGMCTNTSNSASILPGNRFFIEGGEVLLDAPGEWAYVESTRTLLLATDGPGTTPPTSVVIPKATTVLDISQHLPPPPPASCEWEPAVYGRSPGSSLATLPPTTFANCTALCCAAPGCLAVHLDSVHCYLLDRQFEPNFINGSKASGVCADRADIHPPSPPALQNGTSNIVLERLSFADTDFAAVGYQEGFSTTEDSAGMPRDAAVTVGAAVNITISDCNFIELGGGGIHITNGSSHVAVVNSRFEHMGQSGVSMDGGQAGVPGAAPMNCTVANNTIYHVGEVLASAAGIVGSSVSYSNISFNTIRWSSRWGIAIRSNGNNELSFQNVVERNKIRDVGMSTRDMGGLSFIGKGHVNTVVRHNCIRNIIGVDTDAAGRFRSPFFTFGIYLDNWSSGFVVEGNVINTPTLTPIFVHGGSNNTIRNNILFNASTYTGIPAQGGSGWCACEAQAVSFGSMEPGDFPENNTFANNIVYSNKGANVTLISLDGGGMQWKLMSNFSHGLTLDSNLYFDPNVNISDADVQPMPCIDDPKDGASGSVCYSPGTTRRTQSGSWKQWRERGRFDLRSVLADPLFTDAASGDFSLQPGSPALDIGFVPLPAGVDQC